MSQQNKQSQNEFECEDSVYLLSGEVFHLLDEVKITGADLAQTGGITQGRLSAEKSSTAIVGPPIELAPVMDDSESPTPLTTTLG